MGVKENNYTKLLRESISKLKGRLFRINTGLAWVGDKVEKGSGWVKIYNPRPFRNDVPAGFPDTFGFTPIKITSDMVGKTVPVFTLIEVKTETGVVSKKQKEQLEIACSHGIIAGVCRGPGDLTPLIESYLRDFHNDTSAKANPPDD